MIAVSRSVAGFSEWPRKSMVSPLQSNVRFDIGATLTGDSVIVLENA